MAGKVPKYGGGGVTGIQNQPLQVTIVGCKNLANKEWFSRQDPYVVLEYANNKFRTRTDTDGGKNPSFNEKFSIPLIEGLRELNVHVWNSNTLSPDDFIGSAKVLLERALTTGYDDSAWPLKSKSGKTAGEVNLVIHFANVKTGKEEKYGGASSYGVPSYGTPAGYPPAVYPPAAHGATSGYPPAPGGPMGYPPAPTGYPSGYPPDQSYPAAPSGYPPASGYPQPGSGYPPPASGYPPPAPYGTPPSSHGSSYQTPQGYPPVSGYPPSGYSPSYAAAPAPYPGPVPYPAPAGYPGAAPPSGYGAVPGAYKPGKGIIESSSGALKAGKVHLGSSGKYKHGKHKKHKGFKFFGKKYKGWKGKKVSPSWGQKTL